MIWIKNKFFFFRFVWNTQKIGKTWNLLDFISVYPFSGNFLSHENIYFFYVPYTYICRRKYRNMLKTDFQWIIFFSLCVWWFSSYICTFRRRFFQHFIQYKGWCISLHNMNINNLSGEGLCWWINLSAIIGNVFFIFAHDWNISTCRNFSHSSFCYQLKLEFKLFTKICVKKIFCFVYHKDHKFDHIYSKHDRIYYFTIALQSFFFWFHRNMRSF